jgi:1,4-dihydroxy-2-naphthoyl-CoA hydrolase
MEPQPGWDSALGLRIEELTPTRVVGYIDIDERHHQGYGIVHGGVWASVVESVGSHGAAVAAHEITGQMAVVGVANSTDFLRPHRTGRVRATGTPIQRGRTQQIWLVEIEREEDGKMVARAAAGAEPARPAGSPGLNPHLRSPQGGSGLEKGFETGKHSRPALGDAPEHLAAGREAIVDDREFDHAAPHVLDVVGHL